MPHPIVPTPHATRSNMSSCNGLFSQMGSSRQGSLCREVDGLKPASGHWGIFVLVLEKPLDVTMSKFWQTDKKDEKLGFCQNSIFLPVTLMLESWTGDVYMRTQQSTQAELINIWELIMGLIPHCIFLFVAYSITCIYSKYLSNESL